MYPKRDDNIVIIQIVDGWFEDYESGGGTPRPQPPPPPKPKTGVDVTAGGCIVYDTTAKTLSQ